MTPIQNPATDTPPPAADQRPEMSRQEASWHTHTAGQRAATAAQAQGADPTAIAAVATATAGTIEIAGRRLQPVGQGTVWTLQRIAREFEAYAAEHGLVSSPDPENSPGTRELIELGITTLVFIDSRRVWRELDAGRLADLMEEAESLMWQTPLPEQLALQGWFRKQMDIVKQLTGGEEEPASTKKPSQDGVSAEMPIPPPAKESQPSSGLSQNTQSPSPPPSGTPRSS